MAEIVNVLVAFAVIVFVFRWLTSGIATRLELLFLICAPGSDSDRSAADTLGFRPKNVTQDMIDTIQNMFPDIPSDNIRYDLMRTGSVEQSSNKILERGFLDPPPPAYFTLYPRNPEPAARAASGAATASSSAVRKAPQPTLIERYNLQERVKQGEAVDADVGGKAVWEDTAAKREASLKERKAQMILAARQRMLAAQQKES
ncbi:CUE domain-containing protein [Mycena kentingensis (nom. inval.)]|nr:CUE domain-containing protein [Mycena kentingensis (nom. inval.)]